MPHCLLDSVKPDRKENGIVFSKYQFMPMKNDGLRPDSNEEFNKQFQSQDWSKINDLPVATRWILDKIPQSKESVKPVYDSPPLSDVSDDEDTSTKEEATFRVFGSQWLSSLRNPNAEDYSSSSKISISIQDGPQPCRLQLPTHSRINSILECTLIDYGRLEGKTPL